MTDSSRAKAAPHGVQESAISGRLCRFSRTHWWLGGNYKTRGDSPTSASAIPLHPCSRMPPSTSARTPSCGRRQVREDSSHRRSVPNSSGGAAQISPVVRPSTASALMLSQTVPTARHHAVPQTPIDDRSPPATKLHTQENIRGTWCRTRRANTRQPRSCELVSWSATTNHLSSAYPRFSRAGSFGISME